MLILKIIYNYAVFACMDSVDMSIQNVVGLICDRKSRDICMSLLFTLSCLAHSNEGFSFPCCGGFFGEGQFWDL